MLWQADAKGKERKVNAMTLKLNKVPQLKKWMHVGLMFEGVACNDFSQVLLLPLVGKSLQHNDLNTVPLLEKILAHMNVELEAHSCAS